MLLSRAGLCRTLVWTLLVPAACSTGAALAAGQEQAPGWYVGVDAGAVFLDDAENRGHLPDTPADCRIPILGLICLFPTDAVPGDDLSTRLSHDTGYALGFSVGHAFESGWRPELQFAYRRNEYDSLSYLEGYSTLDGTHVSVDGKTESYAFMVNGWYDIAVGPLLRPYLGIGIGGQQIEVSGSGDSDSDFVAAYQAGAGLGFALTELLTLSVDYRFVTTDDPKFLDGQDAGYKSEYQAQTVGLGLRYTFAPSQARDSDGDSVPDYLDQCPGTANGITVDNRGCPLDSDGDGVADNLDKCPNSAPGAVVNEEGCERDSDDDGVADSMDRCPATPKGAAVDAAGCPRDADGDGVPDHLDQCPNTPAGQQVDAHGCRFTDTDGDGVADSADLCPNSPPGVPAGSNGCPLDSDGDGVPDHLDECPQTPAGMAVLPNGCALTGDQRLARPGEEADARGYAKDRDFILHGVTFELDSARLTPQAKKILDQVVVTLKAYPTVKVDVEGHTDSTGTDAYNQALSEKRALSVVDYLVAKGIPGHQMTPVGYGESRPIASNETEEGRSTNRRVAFRAQ